MHAVQVRNLQESASSLRYAFQQGDPGGSLEDGLLQKDPSDEESDLELRHKKPEICSADSQGVTREDSSIEKAKSFQTDLDNGSDMNGRVSCFIALIFARELTAPEALFGASSD